VSGKASLPMYDLPELRAHTDALWRAIARELRSEGVPGVPDDLERGPSLDALWSDPELVFTQTCGYPLTHAFAGRLRVVATPRYAAPGCDGAMYRSFIVVARDSPARDVADLRGARAAVNDETSHSGALALRAHVASLGSGAPFFGETLVTGSHLASLERVAGGEADVAAIDCVTHALMSRARPELIARTRVIARTLEAPSLPYATRADASDELVAALQRALRRALGTDALAPAGAARAALLLESIELLPESAYDRILEIERAAR